MGIGGARSRSGETPTIGLHTVDELTDEALVAARSRLNPAAGVMLSALWVTSTGQLALIVHHLAVDAVYVADPARRPQHRLGPTPQRSTSDVAGDGDVVPKVGVTVG